MEVKMQFQCGCSWKPTHPPGRVCRRRLRSTPWMESKRGRQNPSCWKLKVQKQTFHMRIFWDEIVAHEAQILFFLELSSQSDVGSRHSKWNVLFTHFTHTFLAFSLNKTFYHRKNLLFFHVEWGSSSFDLLMWVCCVYISIIMKTSAFSFIFVLFWKGETIIYWQQLPPLEYISPKHITYSFLFSCRLA